MASTSTSRYANALLEQELWDDIIDRVSAGPFPLDQEISAYSLVSRAFSARAQAHLFREINFRRPTSRLPPRNKPYDQIAASRRLRAVLQSSPHLAKFIRTITIPCTPEIITEVSDMDLADVNKICIEEARESPSTGLTIGTLRLLQALLGKPAVREVEIRCHYRCIFLSHIFRHPSPSMTVLCISTIECECEEPPASSELDFNGNLSLAPSITELRLQYCHNIGTWLAGPNCPFTFSRLITADIQRSMSPNLGKILRDAPALKSLTLRSLELTEDMTADLDLSQFPALQHLSISAHSPRDLPAMATLVSTAAPGNRIENVNVITADFYDVVNASAASGLDQILAGPLMAALRTVEVDVVNPPWNDEIQTWFPALHEKGILVMGQGYGW
ncbi:hypothetical protein B0H17DRAFT_1124938 [Mycena rosella]|uniref:Uncharacterized protein n=1 Tax=Mycena rosella TaxID=1033263 RepID=A0AAD7GYK5_MYCRO|nr:hypothetical protein B0H17DRAFT_1124938 [Mycena rosella]